MSRKFQNKYRVTLAPLVFLAFFCGLAFGGPGQNAGKTQAAFAQDSLGYLFKSGSFGYESFRIPAVVTTKRGIILAFAEGRKTSGGDSGDIDLVMRRSLDGGIHWDPLHIVWSDGGNTCGNPAPVVDKKTGAVYLLVCWNLGTDHEKAIINQTSADTRKVYVLHSNDDGNTWTPPKEITQDVKLANWTWYATGPGHGIQIAKGRFRGRMVVSCDHIEAGTKKYFSHVIFSDDHGSTWKLGGSSPKDQVNESAVVELSNGQLMLNMRNYDRSQRVRQVATSDDGGLTWKNMHFDTALVEPICQASLLKTSKRHQGKKPILFANPADSTKRVNMTVRTSLDNGQTWPMEYPVHRGPSAYSDMANISKNMIGLLYEAGTGSPYQGIAWRRIPISALLKPKR